MVMKYTDSEEKQQVLWYTFLT